MRIIAKKALRDFWELHPDSEQALKAWFKDVSDAAWESFHDVREAFNRASAVGSDRIVFRIRGNHYRLIVRINYEFSIIYIKFIGTHAEYDEVDAATIDHY
ncbi:MAG: type II toxin-antitoxin system HigB family toxin [Phycisphaerae bacterium]|nr:type II toxin-antitoxin system HigB family toxin [Saprospiraceae bacterium]